MMPLRNPRRLGLNDYGMRRNYTDVKINNHPLPVKFLAMPHLSGLLSPVEIRTFLIGGILRYKILTRPESLDGTVTVSEALTIAPRKPLFGLNPHPLANPEMSFDDFAAATDEFDKFAITCYEKLIQIRETKLEPGRRSYMRLFVRFDISVLQVASTGEVPFFVNKISMCQNTGLYIETLSAVRGMSVAVFIAEVLRTSVLFRRHPLASMQNTIPTNTLNSRTPSSVTNHSGTLTHPANNLAMPTATATATGNTVSPNKMISQQTPGALSSSSNAAVSSGGTNTPGLSYTSSKRKQGSDTASPTNQLRRSLHRKD
ncbi:hypothetical protein H2248_005813 [Termitomyces sp. 'cryptogamus']|nr:hypothetical protein H2248_005813 [Termitomyces sp. 'cryptogamus']